MKEEKWRYKKKKKKKLQTAAFQWMQTENKKMSAAGGERFYKTHQICPRNIGI